mgnify:FL=1
MSKDMANSKITCLFFIAKRRIAASQQSFNLLSASHHLIIRRWRYAHKKEISRGWKLLLVMDFEHVLGIYTIYSK